MLVLGVDPGTITGVAVVESGPTPKVLACRSGAWPEVIVPWCGLYTFAGAGVETWEPFLGTPQRMRGLPHQAYWAGRVQGWIESRWVIPVVMLKRSEVLGALGTGRSASKTASKRAVIALTQGIEPKNSHQADAVAAALVAAGRLQSPE